MARLIVEEGGRRRAFKVGNGILTLGTGAEARLKVTASDVAEIHVEVQIKNGQAYLRPRPGVMPPTLMGEPVAEECPLPFGQEVMVGSVRVWVEDENAPTAAPQAAPTQAKSVAAGNQQDKALRRQQAIAQAQQGGNRSKVQRTRPRVERGLPGGVIALLILGGAIVAGFVFWKLFEKSTTGDGTTPVQATLVAVEQHIEDGVFDLASQKLDALTGDMTDAQKRKLESLRDDIADRLAQKDLDLHNMDGTNYRNVKIEKYEQFYLQGSPDRSRVRVFLKRCKYFQERWPQHPDLDWVKRQEKRFQGFVSLGDPPTYDDIAWEIECLTKTNPKYYKESFEIVDDFVADATGRELTDAQALRTQMVADRAEYHLDRMQQARYEYQNEEIGQAVRWLVYGITMMGDEEMADEAANYLINMPDIEPHLRGWRSSRPEIFEELTEHPIMAEYMRDKGII